jgi:hypothetical protein
MSKMLWVLRWPMDKGMGVEVPLQQNNSDFFWEGVSHDLHYAADHF